jgi:hypothetical protein
MGRRARTVYRIEKGQGCGLGVVLGGFALVAAIAAGIKAAAAFWGIVAAAVALGYVVGNAAKKRKCSYCGEPLHGDAKSCHECGGIIEGNVANEREAQAALEAGRKKKR